MITRFLILIAVMYGTLLFGQQSWKTFAGDGAVSEAITSHLEDSYGNFWLGTTDGLHIYSDDQWIHLSQIENSEDKKPERIGHVVSIWEDPGNGIYAACPGKLYHYDGVSWFKYSDADFQKYTVRIFLHDSRDDLWICSEYEESRKSESFLTLPLIKGTVARYNDLEWISYDMFAGGNCYVQPGEPKHFYTALMEDGRGFIYIGSVQGLFIKAGVQWANLRSETLPSENVTSLLCDKADNVWVGTAGGMARFDGKSWETFNKKQGTLGNNVRQICLDSLGRIWAFIYGNIALQGIACFEGNHWTGYESGKDIPEGNIISDMEDLSETNALLTRSGFARFDGQSWKRPGIEQGLEGSRFYFLRPDGFDNFWISSNLGLFRGDGEHFEKVFSPRSGTWIVVSMLCDRQGRVWAVTDDRTVYLTESDNTTVFKPSDGLPDEDLTEIIEDQAGRIWVLYRKGAVLFQF